MKYTKILEVNLFAFAYRLFRRDFMQYVPSSGEKSLRNSLVSMMYCTLRFLGLLTPTYHRVQEFEH